MHRLISLAGTWGFFPTHQYFPKFFSSSTVHLRSGLQLCPQLHATESSLLKTPLLGFPNCTNFGKAAAVLVSFFFSKEASASRVNDIGLPAYPPGGDHRRIIDAWAEFLHCGSWCKRVVGTLFGLRVVNRGWLPSPYLDEDFSSSIFSTRNSPLPRPLKPQREAPAAASSVTRACQKKERGGGESLHVSLVWKGEEKKPQVA